MSARRPLFAALAAAFAAAGAVAAPWADPEVNSLNRLASRAVMVPCESEEMALAIAELKRPRTDSKWLCSLDGEWDFQWKRSVLAKAWERQAKIRVPGVWQLQGDYDPPLYVNGTYPIGDDGTGNPMLPPRAGYTSETYPNPTALYSRDFTLPAGWEGRRTVIHFGGVSSAMYVRLNGREVGYAEDSRLPSEFDLTPFLVSGVNRLEVEVLKHCDGTFLEDQDMWRLSGIYRSVWLVSEAAAAPKDFVIGAAVSDDFKFGSLVIRDERGKVIRTREYANPRLWSAEDPHLYTEVLKFGGDYYAVSFGFRRVEIRDAVLLVNGRRVVIRGVNRHEMSPEHGYTVSEEEMRRDLEIFRRLNINAVRTSHYPDDPLWYDLCDRLGIYVVAEANIESHGREIYTGTTSYSFVRSYEDAHVERGVRMVQHLRNHPSIIGWSLGNEAGYGPNFAFEYKAMRRLDGTRPIQYECLQDTGWSDIKCPMYFTAAEAEAYLTNNPAKPFIHCEYAHAMGNSLGHLEKYTALTHRYPSAQGGFIWDFADQALWQRRGDDRCLCFGGDHGEQPNDDNFNCNGIVAADRSLHPGAWEVWHAYRPIRVIDWDWNAKMLKLRNDWVFTSLDAVEGRWEVAVGGRPLAAGMLDLRKIGPESEAFLKLEEVVDGETITFTFFRREGEEERLLARDQFVKDFVPIPPPDRVRRGVDELRAKPVFYRAPTDNDRGWSMAEKCALWKRASETGELPPGAEMEFEVLRLSERRHFVALRLRVGEGLPPLPRVGVAFTLPADMTNVTWYGLGPHENYPDRQCAAYLAIHHARIDLVSGRAAADGTLGLADDLLNPDNYVEPGEQGHRGGTRWVEFAAGEEAGRKLRVSAINAPFGFNAWPYPQSALEAAHHQYEIVRGDAVTVIIDAAIMGVGGDNSWGRPPHDDVMPGAGEYRLEFVVEEVK